MTTSTASSWCNVHYSGSVTWFIIYIIIILTCIVGNTLTILAVFTCRKLKNLLANRFILSLAISDLLVGFSIPYHMIVVKNFILESKVVERLPCLLRFTLIAFTCTCSINNLLLVSIDRYIAIIHPLHYNRYMTKRVSIVLIAFAWTLAFGIGTSILYWNHWDRNSGFCDINIIPQIFLNYLMAPFFCSIWTTMLIFYIRIVREAEGHVKRMKTSASVQSIPGLYEPSKSFQMVFVILGCFTITWFPYVLCVTIIKTRGVYCDLFYEISFTMAVGNSAMNPLIYAWKNQSFRHAFRYLLQCNSPNAVNNSEFVTNHVPTSGINNNSNKFTYCNGKIEDLIKSEEQKTLPKCEIYELDDFVPDYIENRTNTAESR